MNERKHRDLNSNTMYNEVQNNNLLSKQAPKLPLYYQVSHWHSILRFWNKFPHNARL